MQHVKAAFLPANTTSFLQPMDAGAIACIKRRYRRQQVLSGLNSNDPNNSLLYNVDQLTAMKWIRETWESVKADTVFNWWMKTGLIENHIQNGNGESTPTTGELEKNEIANFLRKSLPVQLHSQIDELLKSNDDTLVKQSLRTFRKLEFQTLPLQFQ